MRGCGCVLAFAVLLGTACSGGSSSGAASTSSTSSASVVGGSASSSSTSVGAPPDPCGLMTTLEVSAFLSGAVTSSKLSPQDCEYSNGSKTLDVSMTIGVGKQKYDATVQAFNGAEAPVSGIGDAATLAQQSNLLIFLKGQNEVGMSTTLNLTSEDDVTRFENLAKQAAARA